MTHPIWKIVWDESLSVGLPEIDAEHQHFAGLINALNQAIVDRVDLPTLQGHMRAIVDDAVQHFAHEEALFAQWNYPDAAEHAAHHADALRSYHAIAANLSAYTPQTVWIEAGLEVKRILIEHLMYEDMKYRGAQATTNAASAASAAVSARSTRAPSVTGS